MSNTPTESEFDKELREILDNHRFDQDWMNTKHENHEGVSEHVNTCIVCNKMETLSRRNIEAIKQAVDKHVIGEDEIEDIDLSKSAKSRWGVRARNRVRVEQRFNLYGGDKK